jgi:hypothetical protein
MRQHACSGKSQPVCRELSSARQTLSLMCWTYRDVPVSQTGRATIMSVRTKHLSGTVIRERSSAGTGPALWSPASADGDRHYLWPGRGAGLFLIDRDGIAPITHPAASGHYSELKQARGALARLLAGRAAHATDPARRRGPRADRLPCTGSHSRGPQTASWRSGSQVSQLTGFPSRGICDLESDASAGIPGPRN